MKKRNRKGIIILSLVLLGGLFLYKPKKYQKVQIGNEIYKLEIADTNAKRAKGLMFRRNLKSDEGMLFIFPQEGRHSFWMYNTYILLDMIWLNNNWEIVHEEKGAPPCGETNPLKCLSYKPGSPAKYVIEIASD